MNGMKLLVGADIVVEAERECPIVAMLRPASGMAQWLSSETYVFDPWVPAREYVDGFGNLCQRMTVPAGTMRIRVEATVETERELAFASGAPYVPVDALPDSALVYLLPSRYCPSDRLVSRAWELAGSSAPGFDQVEAIRRHIYDSFEYRYGSSDASTDALGTLETKVGVCRDFAHVAIAFVRALQIPARMVVGYLHGLEPMDLHAWIEAYVGGRWYAFDATQEHRRGGRVVLAYGRDAADVAFITNYGPLRTTAMRVWVEEALSAPELPARPPSTLNQAAGG